MEYFLVHSCQLSWLWWGERQKRAWLCKDCSSIIKISQCYQNTQYCHPMRVIRVIITLILNPKHMTIAVTRRELTLSQMKPKQAGVWEESKQQKMPEKAKIRTTDFKQTLHSSKWTRWNEVNSRRSRGHTPTPHIFLKREQGRKARPTLFQFLLPISSWASSPQPWCLRTTTTFLYQH